MKYKYPSWYNFSHQQKTDLTDVQLEQIKTETEEIAKENKEIRKEAVLQLQSAKSNIENIFGKYSKEAKYITKLIVPSEPNMDFKRYVLDVREEVVKKKKAEEDKINQEKARSEFIERAILFLQKRNLKLGTDFKLEEAIYRANDIAYDEAITKAKEGGQLISFSGDDNCENCNGWDGESRRCSCGNRRVSWTQGWGFSFENPCIYAEAN